MKNFYLTTPIYYPSAKPHMGHAYSSISADVIARFKRIEGYKVNFLTGTDEHGQKLQEASEKAGLEPKQFVDSVVPTFKKTWAEYEIEYNKFIRTTDDEHKKAVKYFALFQIQNCNMSASKMRLFIFIITYFKNSHALLTREQFNIFF
jgi:methionyl-tRNA synthetase